MDWKSRFVVFDCEATGTDSARDNLVSIGAIVVENEQIMLGEVFETLVRVPYNTASVVVHGVTREASLEGLEPTEAVHQFLLFAGDSTLVGHHVGFDIGLLRRITKERLHRNFANPAIDTMELTLQLEQAGAFQSKKIDRFDLDSLCDLFGVSPHDRHTATGDAFITAQIFLKLLKVAKRVNLTPSFLEEKP